MDDEQGYLYPGVARIKQNAIHSLCWTMKKNLTYSTSLWIIRSSNFYYVSANLADAIHVGLPNYGPFLGNCFWRPHTAFSHIFSSSGSLGPFFKRQLMTLALSRLWSASLQGFCDEWVCPSAKLKKSWNLAFCWVSPGVDGMGKWAERTIHIEQPDPTLCGGLKTLKHIGPTYMKPV